MAERLLTHRWALKEFARDNAIRDPCFSTGNSCAVVILGDPGGGKSTLLKYIARQVSRFHEASELLPFYIPIFLRVSEYARTLTASSRKHLLDYLCYDYDRQYSALFEWAFENCRALLLLDGLDEVLDTTQRIQVVEEVHDIVDRMPENRYVITSRIVGYNEARLGHHFSQLTIQPFSRHEIKSFCEAWYRAVARNSPQGSDASPTEASKLCQAITDKAEIEKLASNPLLITLIANIHFKGQSLPHNRVELYDIATETLLKYWVQSRVTEEGQLRDKDDVIGLLSPIAFSIHRDSPDGTIEETDFDGQCRARLQGDEYGLTEREARTEIRQLKRFLREQTGFFHEKGIDDVSRKRLFGFLHQTFQEYLAAIEVANRWKEGDLPFPDLLLNPRWTEVLRLAAGVLKREKGRAGKRSVTRFVEDMLSCEESDRQVYPRGTLLVSLILGDNIDLTPQTQDAYLASFFRSWSETPDTGVQDEFAKSFALLLKSKHRQAVWDMMCSILSLKDHPLHCRVASVLVTVRHSVEDARTHFARFLLSDSPQVSNAFWGALSRHVTGMAGWQSQETSQYGAPGYSDWDANVEVNALLCYAEFVDAVESLSAESYQRLLPSLQEVVSAYVYLGRTGYGNDWYAWNVPEDLLVELRESPSPRVRAIILAILERVIAADPKLAGIRKNIEPYTLGTQA